MSHGLLDHEVKVLVHIIAIMYVFTFNYYNYACAVHIIDLHDCAYNAIYAKQVIYILMYI